MAAEGEGLELHVPPWLEAYLRGVIVTNHLFVPQIIGVVAKWFFDGVRNLLTVALLFAVAKRFGGEPLNALARLSMFLFALSLVVPAQRVYLDVFHPIRNEATRLAAGLALRTLIGGAIVIFIQLEVFPIVSTVTQWQAR